MSLKKTLVKNTLWLTAAKAFYYFVGYFLIIVIARTLGDVGLGQYSFIFAVVTITFIIADMGLNSVFLIQVSRTKKKIQYYFENIFSIKLLMGVVAILLTISLSFFFNKDPVVIKALWLAALVQFLVLTSGFLLSLFHTHNRMDFNAKSLILERIVAVSLGIYILLKTQSLILFVLVLVLSNFVKFSYLLANAKSKIKIRLSKDIEAYKKLIIQGFPFFLSTTFLFIYFRVDTIMLSFMKGDAVTGWYNSAYRLIDVLTVFPSIIITAIMPSMSKLYKHNKKTLKILFLRIFRYLAMLAMPISIGTFILADRFIDFIYGESFIGGSLSLQILIWAEAFIFVNFLMGTLLLSTDKQKYFMRTSAIALVLNVVLNFLLIPKYSYAGAAISTVFTELFNFMIFRYYVTKFLVPIKFSKPLIKSVGATIIMGLVVYSFKQIAIWYIVPIGAITYFLVLFALKIEKEDKEFIKQVISYSKHKLKL
ncbi:flippase [Candidatus Woesearchaeota archaeon]|nr:flippase [Candidatus Woesearchaeota archaeon]